MKTTKRSKMLVSSIAMLLVALVALGSATYAWYAINRTVTANDINVKASTPGGLQISKTSASSGWTTSVQLDGMKGDNDAARVLEPAALTLSGTDNFGVSAISYYDGSATNTAASTGDATTIAGDEAIGAYYVADEIWVKSDSSKAGSVQAYVKAEGTTTNSFIHIGLIDADNPGSFYGGDKDVSDISTTKTSVGDPVSYQASGGTVKHYYVVVWADGADTDCYVDNSNKTQDISFTVSFELADA